MKNIQYSKNNLWDAGGVIGEIAGITLVFTCIAAFFRHLWWIATICMTPMGVVTAGQVLLAIFGVVFPPLGVVHGFWLWFH